jgi:plastocyanin
VGRLLPILAAVVLLALIPASSAGNGGAAPGSGLEAGPLAAAAATSNQQAKAKALRKCRKIKSKQRRSSCIRKVRKRFAVDLVPQQGPVAARIDVGDKYFAPALVNIRTGQSIVWSWNAVNSDAHNVDLVSPPPGVRRLDFSTPNSPSVNFEFRRTFKVPGTYGFVCSIHHNMTMTVEVSR